MNYILHMDVNNINAFTEVIVNTFETSCNEAPFRCKDFQRVEGNIAKEHELMCVMEFTGTLEGAIIMNFPAGTASKVYGAMMMEDIAEFNEEVAEGFSEILNMIIGNVTANLTGQKLDFKKPECFIGEEYTHENKAGSAWLKVPMAFKELGRFDLFISMKEAS